MSWAGSPATKESLKFAYKLVTEDEEEGRQTREQL